MGVFPDLYEEKWPRYIGSVAQICLPTHELEQPSMHTNLAFLVTFDANINIRISPFYEYTLTFL